MDEDVLNGLCCAECTTYFTEPHGHVVVCRPCAHAFTKRELTEKGYTVATHPVASVVQLGKYTEELSKLSDEQLEAMAREPESAFPPELWSDLQRLLSSNPAGREAMRRSDLPRDQFPDVAGWMSVATITKAGASPDDTFEAIKRVIATDPLYSAFGQAGYPLDLLVSFPAPALEAEGLEGGEGMWVRTVGVAPEPNHWVGRLLNTPRLFTLATKDAYVEFRAEKTGFKFVRVRQAAKLYGEGRTEE